MAKQQIGTAPRRRRPTRAGVVLSEELIVDTALRMLRQHGREGLSARRLAIALDIDPSTLYRYFRSMDELTLAVGDALIAHALDQWAPQGNWEQDLRTLGLRIHRAYLDHPQAAMLTASRVSGRPNEIAADEIILSLLLKAGFPPPAAVRIYQVFIDLCLSFAALDAAEAALPAGSRAADEAMWQTTYAQLPAATHPSIAATADLLVATMADSAFPRALDMLLTAARVEHPGDVPAVAGEDVFLLVDGSPGSAADGLLERMVPQELWELFRSVVPPTEATRPQGGGRRRTGDRETLAAIVFVAVSGCAWRQLPSVFGPSWQTVYRRFARWSREGVWTLLHRAVSEARGDQPEPDWARRAVAAVAARAAGGSPASPVSPGQ